MRINLALSTGVIFENMFLLHDSTPFYIKDENFYNLETLIKLFTSEVKQLTDPVINISAVPITSQVWFWVIYKW